MTKIIDKIRENYVISIASSIVIGLFILMMVVWIRKSTFGIESSGDSISIICPDRSLAGENITCDIKASFNTLTALSVNANYDVMDGVSYVTFGVDSECTENCFDEVYSSSENGFAVINEEGLTGSDIYVGKVVFKMPDEIEANSMVKIGLGTIEISDSEYVMHEVEDVFVEVRILSDIATLEKITLSTGDIFDTNGEVFSYRIGVDSTVDKISVSSIEKSDENSSVDIDINKDIELHYGTNEIVINVVSEDKENTNTYMILVYRDYEYDGEYYIYNEDENYLYTRNDIDDDSIMANLDGLELGLSYKIIDNKLNIMYEEEVLEDIEIINFKLSNVIKDKIIYIGDLTYSEFIGRIELNNDKLSVKIVDSSGTEISSDSKILDGYKMEVYYEEILLEDYSFKIEYFEIDESIFVLDDVNKLFSRVELNTKYKDILSKISTNGSVSIIAHDESELTEDSIVRTGDKIRIKLSDETVDYTISVLGDLTGDGTIKVNDVSRLYRYLKGRVDLDPWYIAAGDIVNSGSVKVNDVSRLYRYLKGRVTSLEVIE